MRRSFSRFAVLVLLPAAWACGETLPPPPPPIAQPDAGPTRLDAGHDAGVGGVDAAGQIDAGCAADDPPDPDGVDTNCDGIDGERTRAVFVASTGDDTQRGRSTDPVASIARALDIAQAEGKRQVLIASGTYTSSDALNLIEGVGLYGGYVAGDWRRARGATVIAGPSVAVLADRLGDDTMLARLELRSSDATLSGAPSIVVRAVSSPGVAIVDGSTIAAGRGGDGVNGTDGDAGDPGGDGQPGADGDQDDQAAAGVGGRGGVNMSCEGANGGAGGRGGRNDSFRGLDGEVSPAGTAGGSGAVTMTCSPASGSDGTSGDLGRVGDDGASGLAMGTFEPSSGTYAPADGGPGTAGRDGAGGGGGGGSSGQTGLTCIDGAGNGGGGGGAGGCGGEPGTAGTGGGPSVGVWLSDGEVRLDRVFIRTAGGGAGGAAGRGALGGTPGAGMPGGTEDASEVGTSGSGGDGAMGGAGGHGGGGGGGPSIGVWTDAELTGARDVGYGLGPAGAGGASDGQPGATGLRAPVHVAP